MGLLTSGMMQSWLPLVLVVLSQLFTVLFIDLIDRVIRRWPGRSGGAQRHEREATQSSDAALDWRNCRTDVAPIPHTLTVSGSSPEPLGTADPILTRWSAEI